MTTSNWERCSPEQKEIVRATLIKKFGTRFDFQHSRNQILIEAMVAKLESEHWLAQNTEKEAGQ